jgi:hypothetical protein
MAYKVFAIQKRQVGRARLDFHFVGRPQLNQRHDCSVVELAAKLFHSGCSQSS